MGKSWWRSRAVVEAMLLLAITSSMAVAQRRDASVVLPGDTVRVFTTTGFTVAGIFDRVAPDVFAVTTTGDAVAHLVPRSAVRRIDLYRGLQSSTTSTAIGLVLGAATGAFLGAGVGMAIERNRELDGMAIGGLALFGLVSGATLVSRLAAREDRPIWEKAALPSPP